MMPASCSENKYQTPRLPHMITQVSPRRKQVLS
jgi:hypothetical protein